MLMNRKAKASRKVPLNCSLAGLYRLPDCALPESDTASLSLGTLTISPFGLSEDVKDINKLTTGDEMSCLYASETP